MKQAINKYVIVMIAFFLGSSTTQEMSHLSQEIYSRLCYFFRSYATSSGVTRSEGIFVGSICYLRQNTNARCWAKSYTFSLFLFAQRF